MWSLCEGRFSYSDSPQTPPLEGTSLHRRNNSVERPWGILSLFTMTSDFTLPEAVTQTIGVFAKGVGFLSCCWIFFFLLFFLSFFLSFFLITGGNLLH